MSHRIILTIAFLLTISILRSTPYFYIKVETPSVWTAECALLNAQKELRIYKIELQKETNDAHFTLDIEEPKLITLTYAGESFDIFVEPTDDLKIVFSNQKIKKTIQFQGQGANNNTVFSVFQSRFRSNIASDFQKTFLSPLIDKVTESRILSSDAATFLSLTDADKEAALQFIESSKSKINKKLYSQLWTEINYTYDAQLYAYFLLKKMSSDEFRLTTQKFFPFKGFNYTDYERNETSVFRNALKTFIHYQALQFQNDDDPNTLYETIEKKAAWLFYLVNNDHPFTNGNKRVAVMAYFVFLSINCEELYFDEETINNELFEIATLTAASFPDEIEVIIEMLMVKTKQYSYFIHEIYSRKKKCL